MAVVAQLGLVEAITDRLQDDRRWRPPALLAQLIADADAAVARGQGEPLVGSASRARRHDGGDSPYPPKPGGEGRALRPSPHIASRDCC